MQASWVNQSRHKVACARQIRSGSSGSAEQRGVQPPDVPELAKLAHVAVTEAEVKEWSPKIEGIVDWFGQLQEVDVEGVPPALRAEVENENFLRKDLPRQYEQRETLVQQFPSKEGNFLKVPKIATAADD